MSDKIKVLILSDWYLPGYRAGGPIRTIANLVSNLGDKVEFSIITRDRDDGMQTKYPDVQAEFWSKLGKSKVYYVDRKKLTLGYWRRLLNSRNYDVLYLNSLFSADFALKPVLLARLGLLKNSNIILAPRGELGAGALSIKKNKKVLFLRLAEIFSLYRNVNFQASTKEEEEDIYRIFRKRKVNVIVARNPIAPLPNNINPTLIKRKGELRLAFLSRISPKKNLLGALQLLKHFQQPLNFEIYGPISDREYWSECLKIIDAMPQNISVKYKGVIDNDKIFKIFNNNHFFYFLTLGENFGHVIYESFAHGCPVLISNTTIWRDLGDFGLGWDVDINDEQEVLRALEQAFNTDKAEYLTMRKKCRTYAQSLIDNSESLRDNYEMFDINKKMS